MIEKNTAHKLDVETKVKLVDWFNQHFYKVEWLEKGKDMSDYFPSVTTKLGVTSKPFLARWRGDIGNREADYRLFEAAERGSRIHNAWDILKQGGVIIYQPYQCPNYTTDELSEIVASYPDNHAIVRYQDEMYDLYKLQRWHEIVNPEVLASESMVTSLEYREAGTADAVLQIEGGLFEVAGAKPLLIPEGTYIADLKTGKFIDDDAELQIAAYAMMYEEMGRGKIDGGIVIHTGSSTKKGIKGLNTILRSRDDLEQDFKKFRIIADAWAVKNPNFKAEVFEFPSLIKL